MAVRSPGGCREVSKDTVALGLGHFSMLSGRLSGPEHDQPEMGSQALAKQVALTNHGHLPSLLMSIDLGEEASQ